MMKLVGKCFDQIGETERDLKDEYISTGTSARRSLFQSFHKCEVIQNYDCWRHSRHFCWSIVHNAHPSSRAVLL